ncbi:MAG: RNA polymerase sigma factor [candidate division Zixibacteria bacterium]|nr:RNA polymerase sigma factor [candidate division Zixibacteria bacterium]
MNEKELVKKAQAGDFEAFTDLINAHKSTIYGLARRLAGNQEDAEDIVQDTFLKAIDKIDQFRLESSFGTWLYTIALNQARGMFSRRQQTDIRTIEEYLPGGQSGHDHSGDGYQLFDWQNPESLLENSQLREIIDRLISELPYKYREAFVLRYLEELPVKEVARQINESEAATKSRILRARLALRDQLSDIFEAEHGQKMS